MLTHLHIVDKDDRRTVAGLPELDGRRGRLGREREALARPRDVVRDV